MKNQVFVVSGLVMAFGLLLTGCTGQPETATAQISVVGMKCDMCVSKVEKALDGLEGVQARSVDLDNKTASVTFETTRLKLADLETAIAGAGFDANDTKRDPQAYEDLPSCCQDSEPVEM